MIPGSASWYDELAHLLRELLPVPVEARHGRRIEINGYDAWVWLSKDPDRPPSIEWVDDVRHGVTSLPVPVNVTPQAAANITYLEWLKWSQGR